MVPSTEYGIQKRKKIPSPLDFWLALRSKARSDIRHLSSDDLHPQPPASRPLEALCFRIPRLRYSRGTPLSTVSTLVLWLFGRWEETIRLERRDGFLFTRITGRSMMPRFRIEVLRLNVGETEGQRALHTDTGHIPLYTKLPAREDSACSPTSPFPCTKAASSCHVASAYLCSAIWRRNPAPRPLLPTRPWSERVGLRRCWEGPFGSTDQPPLRGLHRGAWGVGTGLDGSRKGTVAHMHGAMDAIRLLRRGVGGVGSR